MSGSYGINSTSEYHRGRLSSLGWEMTVCNSLVPEGTALRRILGRDDSFGHRLYDHLSRFIPMERLRRVLEIGGGYGYLMRDFLGRNSSLSAFMVDISPVLLDRQRETLSGYPATFREEDFLETDLAGLEGFDLAVMNENLGDFPTVTKLTRELLKKAPEAADPSLRTTAALVERYGLEVPPEAEFNFNLGAVQALEKLCAAGIPWIYLGEHSCEASAPEMLRSILDVAPSGDPERIALMGHDEYTIKFSHLERVADTWGYARHRGPFAHFLTVPMTDRVRFALAQKGRWGDEEEMICHFVEDTYKYEYLVLSLKGLF